MAGSRARLTRQNAKFGASGGSGAPKGSGVVSEDLSGAVQPFPRILDHWELWFPARLGPPRRRTVMTGGRKVTGSVRVDELPPTHNDRLHHHAKAKWVKEWRQVARDMARARDLGPLERVRVSMIVYRPRLGVADQPNDVERMKPLVDGLVEAGALAGDTYRHLQLGTIEERRGDHGILLIVQEV